MAGSVNKVILIGNLGRDPEVHSGRDGSKIVGLSVATSDTWKDKATGERRERTEWHRVVIFNEALADVAQRFLRKGAKVYLEGALQTRKWTDTAGVERWTTEVVLPRFRGDLKMLDGRQSTTPGTGQDTWSAHDPARQGPPAGQGGGQTGGADLDDEIPF